MPKAQPPPVECQFLNPGQCLSTYRHQRCANVDCECPIDRDHHSHTDGRVQHGIVTVGDLARRLGR